MDEQGSGSGVPVPRGGLRSAGLVAAGLVAGLVLAGLGVASAQGSPSPRPERDKRDERVERPFGKPGKPGGFGALRGRRGGPGIGHGPGRGAIHGEYTVALPEGGYRTYATQRGKVTAVGATSITVRSDDGHARTYQVGDETLVNAGDDGIADVKEGDEVRVLAVVSGGTARAVEVVDVTRVRQSRERWLPRPRGPGAAESSGT